MKGEDSRAFCSQTSGFTLVSFYEVSLSSADGNAVNVFSFVSSLVDVVSLRFALATIKIARPSVDTLSAECLYPAFGDSFPCYLHVVPVRAQFPRSFHRSFEFLMLSEIVFFSFYFRR